MRYETGLASRLGNRAVNQDRNAIVSRNGIVLLLLADGMGGHERGELAAQTLIDSVSGSFYREPLPLANPEKFLQDAVKKAHRDIVNQGLEQTPAIHPRTTAVVCLVQQGRAWWAHVGDSRLYLLRNGEITVRTRDHTYVEDLYRHRAISEEEMLTHPMRNYVTHCLGGHHEAPRVTSSGPNPMQPGDVLLLCSDGLWSAVRQEQFAQMIGTGNLEAAVDRMAEAAENASYPNSDNISIVALRLLVDREVGTGETHEQALGAVSDASDQDRLADAIERIHAAIREYQHEFQED
jgi:serine/threonine protein phosphatase PrpC